VSLADLVRQGDHAVDLNLEVFGFPAILIVMGLVELAKRMGFPARYSGLLSLVLGIALMMIYTYFTDVAWARALVSGIVVGLSASGLWSISRSVMHG